MRSLATVLFLTACCANALSAADFLGGLYATTQDDRLIRFNADGSYVTVLSGLPDPKGLEFGDARSAYITCQTYQAGSEYGSLRIFDPNGIQTFFADGIPATNRFSNGTYAAGVAVDVDGTAYVATHNSPGMTRVELDGTVDDFTGYAPELWWGRQAAISPSGRLVTSNATSDSLYEVDKVTGQRTLLAPGKVWSPDGAGIAFDESENLYVSEHGTDTIWRLEPDGTLSPLTTVPMPNYSAYGNGILYVSDFDLSVGFTRIWAVDVADGSAALFATTDSRLDDVAFLNVSVPEPSSLVLMGAALLGLGFASLIQVRTRMMHSLSRKVQRSIRHTFAMLAVAFGVSDASSLYGGVITPVSVTASGTFNNSETLLIDGVFPVRGSPFFEPTNVWWDLSHPSFLIDFGGLFHLHHVTVAVDNNDDYIVESSEDGVFFSELVRFVSAYGPVFESQGGMDILTTDPGFPVLPDGATDPTTPSYIGLSFVPVYARYIRLSHLNGDLAFGVGELQALGVHPGDANDDGQVSGADYTIWADNFDDGMGAGGKSWMQGDWTGDGYVSGADYTIWADYYGVGVPGSPVPEPSSLTLFASAMLGFAILKAIKKPIEALL